MIKNKLAIVIPLFLIMILSACSFKSKNYDDNKEKADKESYIIKYALNIEDVEERLNSITSFGSLNFDGDIKFFNLNLINREDLSARVYFYYTTPEELVDFQMTKLDENLVEYFKLEEVYSAISGGWLPGDPGWQKYPEYNYKSYYQIKTGPIFLFYGEGSGELNEKEIEVLKEDLRFLANIFYLTLKYPDFTILNSAYSYNGKDFYFFDFTKKIFSEVIMNCSFNSDCILNKDYYRVISIAKNNKQDKINEIISKVKNYNYDIDPKKLEAYNEHISRLKPICQNNICTLSFITDKSDKYYLINLYNNAFNETIVKNISYDNLKERYNLFVWLNSKDDYIKASIYLEDNIDLDGYEIKYLNNSIVEYSQFKEEVEIMTVCLEDMDRTCAEREYYHYNFSVYYKLENGLLFEFVGGGRGSLKDLDKNKLLKELRFTINLLELPLKHKDFKYTGFAISYNGKDYYFIDIYRSEFSNLSMNCQTDKDCLVFPYYCNAMTAPYIPLSTKNDASKIENLRKKVEYFNNNFLGKCIDLPENYFASQCLNNVCALTRGENQTSNTKNYLHLKQEIIKQE